MPKRLTPAEAAAEIAKRASGERRVVIPGGCAEPTALRDAWRAAPELAANLTFCGVFMPGVNVFDYSSLHPTARLELFLMTPELRDAFSAGRATLTPAHYSQTAKLIAEREISVAVLHLSQQDGSKRCSFGLAADIGPSLVGRADYTIGLVNKQMPNIDEAPSVSERALDAIVAIDEPLVGADAPSAAPGAEKIAAHAARFVFDDDVVQFGIGRLPSAIFAALTGKQRLRVFSGMVSDALLPHLDAGNLLDEPAAITTGLAIGSQRLYDRLARERRLKLMPITHTHAFPVLSRIEKLVSINACLEVDLFGQINAEFAGPKQIASVGGLCDFVRAARAAPGGRAIVALTAEGKDASSRILPHLPHGAVTISRYDAPIVVTEHGAADLDGLDMDERAQAIIAIAAPAHRESLQEQWAKLRKTF